MSDFQTYKHNPDFKPASPFLSDSAMEEVMDGRPNLCVDVLLIDSASKELILPWRTRKPAEGPWFFGGMIKRNIPPQQMAAKIISKEAGVDVDASRLNKLDASWFEWDYRDGPGSENGRVDFNLCYTLEPTPEEIAAIENSLEAAEYDTKHGLTRYNRDKLVSSIDGQSACKQVLVDYYDQLF